MKIPRKNNMIFALALLLASVHTIVPMEQIGAPEAAAQEINDHHFMLPIFNLTLPNGSVVRINFKPTIKGFKRYGTIDTITEFIPQAAQTHDDAQEIIITEFIKGKQTKARDHVNLLRDLIAQEAQGVKTVEKLFSQKDRYDAAKLVFTYHKNYRRMMLLYYLSGKYDCSGIRYELALTNGICEQEALAKVNEFIKNNLLITKHIETHGTIAGVTVDNLQ
jgi:hypothetical protein